MLQDSIILPSDKKHSIIIMAEAGMLLWGIKASTRIALDREISLSEDKHSIISHLEMIILLSDIRRLVSSREAQYRVISLSDISHSTLLLPRISQL